MPKPKNPLSPKPAKKATAKKTKSNPPLAGGSKSRSDFGEGAKKNPPHPAPAKRASRAKPAQPSPARGEGKTSQVEKYVTEQKYLILKSLDDGKAEDILDFDLRGHSSLADYIIIASGRSTRQVSSLAENISKSLKAAGHKILGREDQGTNDWVIVDTGDIIVHILRPEVRAYYRLEDMWRK